MTSTARPWDDDADDDLPLTEDDRLLQRYLEGLTDPEETLAVELRLDVDDAFAARVEAYAALFEALDRAAAARAPAPAALVQEAVAHWQAPPLRARTALLGFAAVDLAMLAMLAVWGGRHGPAEAVARWARLLAEASVVSAALAASPALPATVAAAAVAAIVGLSGTSWAARGVLRRAGVWP